MIFSKLIPNLLSRTSNNLIKNYQIIRTFSFSFLIKPLNFKNVHVLSPLNNIPLSIIQVRGVKVRSAVKKRCKDCYSVRRSGILYIRCKVHPRHKQRQG